MNCLRLTWLLPLSLACAGAAVPVDLSSVRPGPIGVSSSAESITVQWKDETDRAWTSVFSLDPTKPLITSIGPNGSAIIERARPLYQCTTGKRRGGWDAFFDFPPSHPEGTHSYMGDFQLRSARAQTIGNRVEVAFEGLHMGPFEGTVRYLFFPHSRLIQQVAVLSTSEPDTAYFYDAGLRMTAEADRRPGGNMESHVSYFDTKGDFQTSLSDGPERRPAAVRYRSIAAHMARGSVAVFPPPHQYFFPRDYTTNMGYVWHQAWRGTVGLGIRQLPDDASPYYPWSNAPPGTEQRMSLFLLPGTGDTRSVLNEVLRYTHADRFPAMDGYKTFAPHWHFAYTVQATAKGFDWTPPFKPVLEAMGVDAAMIMDFHGDGHPQDTTDVRTRELDAFFRACRAQSSPNFLLIPAEEANVYFGGHWAVAFPKPVYWYMSRQPTEALRSTDPKYGTVYRVRDEKDLLDLVRAENGFVYQTHPRTKGSTGYPDKIRDTAYFLDHHYFGAGWKALPSDLTSPRLGERAFRLLDDMSNWGLRKNLMGEVDVFQIDSTHELYSHMNVNYVKLPRLPSFDNYGNLLDALRRGEFFTTTGEVLLRDVQIGPGRRKGGIYVGAKIEHTFPLEMAEVVWGDGAKTFRKIIPLNETGAFDQYTLAWEVEAPGWKWARLAVWDVAADGAFVNPVWQSNAVVAVDGFHNDEKEHPDHYRWDGTTPGGYSKAGKLIQSLGAELQTVRKHIGPDTLAAIKVFIIADPDTPAETPAPQYIADDEINALDKWVRSGGRLVLLGNDKGNAEFAHLNRLAARFGIEFLETTHRNPEGQSKLNLMSTTPLLGEGLTAYLVDVAPLKVTNKRADILLAEHGVPIMAMVKHGDGYVVALGDPWFYNEYINSRDNRRMTENLFRALLASPEAAKRSPYYAPMSQTAEAVRAAIATAGQQQKRVLIRYTGPWCRECAAAPQPKPGYVTVAIDEPNQRALQEFANGWSVDLRDGPLIVVLEGDGRLVHVQANGDVPELPAPDAADVLASTLARAREQDKRVLLEFGADWCAPCLRLERFVRQPDVASVLNRNYVIASIDIGFVKGGRDLAYKLGSVENDGVPWLAILDEDGHVRATSTIDGRNIGFPTTDRDRKQFIQMLAADSVAQTLLLSALTGSRQ